MSTGIRIEYQKLGVDGKLITEGLVVQVAHVKHHELHANGTGVVIHLHNGTHHDLPHADFNKVSEQIKQAKGE